jgi:polyhydroxyalkanoate synthesis regulator phasin
MAKKDKKKAKKEAKPADPVGAVRTAVERTFQATAGSAQSTRTRAQDLVDEVAGAAGRVREMIDDMRVLEDLKGLRTEMEALSRRVAALEAAPPAKAPAARRRTATAKAPAARRRTATAKPAASTARSTPKRKPSTTPKASGTSRSGPAAAKTRSAARRKPAA